ncbi:inosamine-phosphate amidinotransferase 1 [Hyalangium versicolor]|uniref:inosamine-phosphate amidinotransferase 1 n=1 Tax=Hyalangium versicolor TaxID=2861190 RepID=UPI001CC95193|nr:inosamine-phosphate amidinotransferase 1 [Hyalangium versicolor]
MQRTNLQLARETQRLPVVSSYTEWDPLEEVIVGVADGATVPTWHVSLKATMPKQHWEFFQQNGGKPFPKELIDAANRDLDEFAHILEAEGIKVRRPERIDHARAFSTPDWHSPGGLYTAMPRDLLLVIGDEIIETPMPWRSRYFEVHPYRKLLKEYFMAGARWTSAPKPQLTDEAYDLTYEVPGDEEAMRYVLTEFEPLFDAADFIRCGRDIFYIRSHVTNTFGVEWLRRHLGSQYRIHELRCRDTKPMHIDTTFMPMAPGKLLVNPERVDFVPDMFRTWDILKAPQPCSPDDLMLYFSGKWLSMNTLMLDEERVVVDKNEHTLIRAFKDWGFKPITCHFQNFYRLGGSFHCATLDIRRRGTLQSYF